MTNQSDNFFAPLAPTNGRPSAKAIIKGSSEFPELSGMMMLYQTRSHVLIAVNVQNLPKTKNGFFGLHIHEGDRCENSADGQSFISAGDHFNPNDVNHPQHAGDLPPLLCNFGSAFTVFTAARFYVGDVLGCTVIIHDMPDDFTTQPAGNSGKRIACGIILP